MTFRRSARWPHRAPLLRRLARARGGAVAVEMAMALPILLTMLMGILSYGEWFLTAHSVQAVASDAARAALIGLSPTERQQVAVSSAQALMRRGGLLDPARASFAVDDDGTIMVVRLLYDASADPLLNLGIVPTPGSRIQRSGTIRLDGL